MIELEKHFYSSVHAGPHLLITGCIHGNEVCGYRAITNLINKLNSGEVILKRGSLTLIPVCNPPAFYANKREVNVNLNRYIGEHTDLKTYEYKVANQVAKAIKNCDYHVDLHSFSDKEGEPFAFEDYDEPKVSALARTFGLAVVKGWPALYPPANEKVGDSGFYAHSLGKVSVTVECGSNGTEAADKVAADCIIKALNFLEMADAKLPEANAASKVYVMDKIETYQKEGRLSREWNTFDFIKAGEVVAEYDDGEVIKFATDCYMIMPNKEPKVGDEWFYTAHLEQ
ncbi:MAG: succinylglutamate desuccinylase/aspartoacylase family protein [Spirochaetaceae bacterium]|nr:succinylglutamate desuccinylase/aspartoacylase family protein [Spirochaetaceae bacterium]